MATATSCPSMATIGDPSPPRTRPARPYPNLITILGRSSFFVGVVVFYGQGSGRGRYGEEEEDGPPASPRRCLRADLVREVGATSSAMGASASLPSGRYQQAIVALSSIKLDKLVQDLGKVGRDRAMKRIVSTFQKSSAARLLTLGDLLCRMLDVKASVPMGRTKKLATADSRWSVRRMERAAEAVVEALRAARGRGMSHTGLLDFVLKSLGGCVVGAHLVRRCLNPATRVLAFSRMCGACMGKCSTSTRRGRWWWSGTAGTSPRPGRSATDRTTAI